MKSALQILHILKLFKQHYQSTSICEYHNEPVEEYVPAIGITTGTVFVGCVGSIDRFEYAIVGDSGNQSI